MPKEIPCPHCGQLVMLDTRSDPSAVIASLPFAHTVETVIPGTSCGDDTHAFSAGSWDAGLGIPNPQEDLFAVKNDEVAAAFDLDESGSIDAVPAIFPESGEFDPLARPVADSQLDVFVTGLQPEPGPTAPTEPSQVPPVADIGSVLVNGSPPAALPTSPAAEEQDVDEVPPVPWAFVLLSSYASAVTLALIWLLWTGQGQRATGPETLPVPTRVEPAKRAAKLTPIPKERITGLGIPLVLGSLEFTPLEILARPVRLDGGGAESGGDSLILRARFKNLSKSEVFAPLLRDLIRVKDSGESETLIETEGEPIETYPLAVASERMIAGQSFAELKPGEAMETILASDRDAKSRLSAAMIWRIKLHVGADRSEIVGIKFGSEDVR